VSQLWSSKPEIMLICGDLRLSALRFLGKPARGFMKKLCPRKSGAEMRKTAMPPNSGGRCVSYAPGRRRQKISETAILPNTRYRGVLKIVTF